MKTVEIEGQKYEIRPLGVENYTFLMELFGRVIQESCTPPPTKPQHTGQIVNEIITHTFEQINKARFFRPSGEPSRRESNDVSSSSAPSAIEAAKT